MKRIKGELTVKQQLRARTKVFKLLTAIGFQFDTKGGYYWRKIADNVDRRLCVGFGVPNQLFGNGTDWVWYTAALNEEPRFGYGGTTSSAAQFGTVEKVMNTTLGRLYSEGFSAGFHYEHEKITKIREKMTAAFKEILGP